MKEEIIKIPDYNEEERDYVGELKEQLTTSRDTRETAYDYIDGMTYTQSYENNQKGALTYIEPKKDKYDNNFQSGTIRSKIRSVLAYGNNLNLSPDISAFDSENIEVNGLGNALEQVIYKTEEIEVDEEKKIQRQQELLEQGTVFVEEVWQEKTEVIKKGGKFTGKIEKKWKKRIKKALSQPERNIICGLGVYLGDIRQYFIEKQPYIFTVETMPYSKAKEIFGKWERWEFVPKKIVRNSDTEGDTTRYNWHITDVEDDRVEIIRYQNLPKNEYAVIINGVLMTPVGLPLQWGWNGYNITQQNLEILSPHFAYGKSMVARLKSNTAILDELLRLMVLKTQKSFQPPYLNISGRVLSSKVFMPGKITNGILPNQLQPLSAENTGVTGPEMSAIEKIEGINDKNSVSPVFQGQGSGREVTATENMNTLAQSKQSAGGIITSFSLLEYKLSWLRLYNILDNWFEPVDTQVNDARKLVKKYRTVNRPTEIEGRGMGRTMVLPTKEPISAEEIKTQENTIQKAIGRPVRIITINPEEVKKAKYIWQIVIKPREKKTSELGKLTMREMITDYMTVSQIPSGYLKEKWANAWELDSQKLFPSQQEQPQQTPQGTQQNIPATQNIQNGAKKVSDIKSSVA